MQNIRLLKNTVQDYVWGSPSAIPELLGKKNPDRHGDHDNQGHHPEWMEQKRRDSFVGEDTGRGIARGRSRKRYSGDESLRLGVLVRFAAEIIKNARRLDAEQARVVRVIHESSPHLVFDRAIDRQIDARRIPESSPQPDTIGFG